MYNTTKWAFDAFGYASKDNVEPSDLVLARMCAIKIAWDGWKGGRGGRDGGREAGVGGIYAPLKSSYGYVAPLWVRFSGRFRL